MTNNNAIGGSFRDPSGFVFIQDGSVYRQVNKVYQDDYDHLMNSGLYQALVDAKELIGHESVGSEYFQSDQAYKVLRPQPVPFISYPYEWCFSQLKQAALTTLRIQKRALEFGMTLKDSSAYNIQFLGYQPILIDTLSFERYKTGQIWFGYRQFCQHFLAPLALMARRDIRLNQLLRVYIDGIELDLAGKLLPWHSRVSFSLLAHIHLHARSQEHFADKAVSVKNRNMSKLGFMGLIDSCESAIKRMRWKPKGTEWGQYYDETNYCASAMRHKEKVVAEFLSRVRPKITWDLGANTGVFSRIAADTGSLTISFDMDPAAVEKNYHECAGKAERNIIPLVLDLTNPSGAIGWGNQERKSLIQRGPADTVMALALIHHLAISNNLPLGMIAEFLAEICRTLIIEFVPKSDSQVQRLLASREDIFPDYTQEAFENVFQKYFSIHRSKKIENSERTLYLMEKIE